MKGKNLFITLGLALGLGFGVAAGLSAGKDVKEVKATGPLNAGESVYLRLPSDNWGADAADYYVYAFGGTADSKTFTPMTEVSTDKLFTVFTAVIPENNGKIIFTRFKPGTTAQWNIPELWNQSADLVLSEATSNLWVKKGGNSGNDGGWASGTYSETATNLSLTFYAAQTSDPTHCYAWDKSGPLNGAYPGEVMSTPTKATHFQNTTLYKQTLNYTTHMSDHSDVSLNMILNIGNDYDKSATIDIVTDGAYFYANGLKWENGYVQSVELGASAKVAWDLATVDICNLPATGELGANALRDAMDAHASDLASSTWAGFTYEQAYKLVDSKCTVPNLGSRVTFGVNNVDNTVIIIVAISAIAVASLILFVSLKKKKHN